MGDRPIVILAGQPPVPMGLAAEHDARGAILVYHAVSGSPLSTEKDSTRQGDRAATGVPGSGEHLAALQAKIDAVLTPGSAGYIEGAHVAGMVWVQGETDAISRVAAAEYQDSIKLDAGNDIGLGRGGEFDDVLIGEDGRDTLLGGSGDDWLYGGRGIDMLRPGAGADEIVWRPNDDGHDRVFGFMPGEDLLVFERTGVAFDTLVFRTAGDNLKIFADGDRIDVTLVLVDGADLGLSEADFLFL